jgi:heavy metal sensor kinase
MTAWSVRTRLTLWNGLVIVAVLAGFGLASYLLMARTLLARTDGVLEFEYRETAERLAEGSGGLKPGEIPEAFLESFLLRITDAGGHVLLESPKFAGHPLVVPGDIPKSVEPSFFSAGIGGVGHHRVVVGRDVDSADGRQVLIAVPLAEYDQELADFRRTLLFVSPIGILAALVGGYWSAGRALRPVHLMTQTARNISEHNLRERLVVGNPNDELGRLATTLNQVFDRLADSLDSMRRFTADASHELMTPLATIRAEAEVALQSPRSPEHHAEVLGSIVEEVGRLTRLAGRLLLLARADAGTTAVSHEDVRLDEVLREAVARIQSQAQRSQVSVRVEGATDETVVADPDQLRQVFDNLLDNGVKYNRAGGTVTASVHRKQNQVVVEIVDTGIGIRPEVLPHIFDRFVRGDASRSRKGGGAGLGLSIVRALIESMRGRIEAESQLGEGTTFRIFLPAKDEF